MSMAMPEDELCVVATGRRGIDVFRNPLSKQQPTDLRNHSLYDSIRTSRALIIQTQGQPKQWTLKTWRMPSTC